VTSTRFIRKPLAHSLVDGEVVVMDTEADEYVCFGLTGSFIWHTLEKDSTLEEISAAVASNFQAPFEIVEQDCREFVESLLLRGYVSKVDS
jgi:hypothetical protein